MALSDPAWPPFRGLLTHTCTHTRTHTQIHAHMRARRFLASEALSDPAWPSFRGVAEVPRCHDLLKPGTQEAAQLPQEACPLRAPPASGFASALPTYVPPQGKGVKVGETLQPAALACPGTKPGPAGDALEHASAQMCCQPWCRRNARARW